MNKQHLARRVFYNTRQFNQDEQPKEIDKLIPELDESHFELDEKSRSATLTDLGNDFVEEKLKNPFSIVGISPMQFILLHTKVNLESPIMPEQKNLVL